MASNLPTLIKFIQAKTLDWTSPFLSETNLFLWNLSSGVKNTAFFQENIISSYNHEKYFSILVIDGSEENSESCDTSQTIYTAIERLLSDFQVSDPFTSKFFLGFLTWENLSTDLEFLNWRSKYLSLSKKDKIKLLKSISKKSEAKQLEKSKSNDLKYIDEIVAIVTIAKKNPSVKNIIYISEGIEFSCSAILGVQVLGVLMSYDSRTLASLGDVVRPNKIKGFFKGIGATCTKLAGCIQMMAKSDDYDDDDD